jgi:hypothetical protein
MALFLCFLQEPSLACARAAREPGMGSRFTASVSGQLRQTYPPARLSSRVTRWPCRSIFRSLFFIELSTRKVQIAGIASTANGLWMSQIGRNLTDAVARILKGKPYLIHDHDPLFTTEFLNLLAHAGVKSAKLPPRSPNLNACAE